MRISSIPSVSCSVKTPIQKKVRQNLQEPQNNENTFRGSYPITKNLARLGAAIGAVAAAGGAVIATGGLAIPVIIAGGLTGAGSAGAIGYLIEKPDKKDNENK